MHLRSIRWRLVTIYVLLVIIVMMASGTLIVYLTRDNEYKVIKNDLRRLAALATAISAEDDASAEALEKQYMNLLMQGRLGQPASDSIICMLRPNGEVIYTTSEVETAKRILTPQTMAASASRRLCGMAHRFEQQIEEKHRADDAEDGTHRHFVGIADEAGDDVGDEQEQRAKPGDPGQAAAQVVAAETADDVRHHQPQKGDAADSNHHQRRHQRHRRHC